MSWNPFNKLMAPKKSTLKAFEDSEFDVRVQQVVQIEQAMKKLHKDTKKSVESSSALSKVEQRMMFELLNGAKLIKDAEMLTESAEKLTNISCQTEDSQSQRDVIIRSTFIQPLKGLNDKFPGIHSAVKRREQSQQDYTKYLARKEKFAKDPSSTQTGKYEANEKYLERTKTDFDRRTKQLQDDLPKFNSESLNYFNPCFKALMQAELNHDESLKYLYEDLAKDFGVENEVTDEEFQQDIDKMLEDITALSIVKAN